MPAAHRFPTQEQVVGDRQVRRQCQVLVHGVDAQLQGMTDGLDRDRLAPVGDLARVGLDRAAQDLGQGRLAGTVVADEGEHLARSQDQVSAPQAPAGAHRTW